MNYVRRFIYPKFGKFGLTISPLYYRPEASDEEIANILKKEVAWQEGIPGKQKKHFDCWAEPFTNYIREQRTGYSRRVCQYSQKIRLGEMTRQEALQKLSEESPEKEPETTTLLLEKLDLTREELNQIIKIPLFEFDKYGYLSTKIINETKEIFKV